MLYLSTQHDDFEGGTFFWSDPPAEEGGPRRHTPLAPSKGAAIIFSSGWENMHEVEPLASGAHTRAHVHITRTLALTLHTSAQDGELSTFLNSRKFSGVVSADDWVRVPCNHLKMNLTVAVYAVIGVAFTTIVQRRTVYGALVHCVLVWVTFVVLHAVSHVVGVAVSLHVHTEMILYDCCW